MVKPCRVGDPDSIGPFRLLGRLGVGGFGTVYIGCAGDLAGELVAVKVVHDHLAGTREFRSRFTREIAAIKRVKSHYVPRLVDDGAADERPWLATELIPGLSLDQVIHSCGPLPEPALWHLAAGIADALAAIHAAGLVHRDLKPQNVLLVPAGPRIIDFSLAHLTELPHQTSSRHPMATYQYAAPEQVLRGLQAAGRPADVFAIGGTLLFAATGHPPHEAESQPELIDRARNARPNLDGLPRGAYDVVSNCLLRVPDARPSLAQLKTEFAGRIGRHGDDGPGAFAAILPPAVVSLLADYGRELADAARAGRRTEGPRDELEHSPRPRAEETPLPPYPLDEPPAMTRQLTDAIMQTEQLAGLPFLSAAPVTKPPGAGQPAPPDGSAYAVRWKHAFAAWVRAPVAVAGDIAVTACLDGTVTCLRADSGTELWTVAVDAAVRSAALLLLTGRPEGRGTALVGAADGGVYAIDVATGRHRSLFHAAGAIEGPPVAAGGRVYIMSADGCVHEIDAHASGRQVLFRMDGQALGAPAVTLGTVFAASADGCVYAVDTATRKERWRLPTGGVLHSAPVPVAGHVYIAGTDGLLREVDAENARKRTVVEIGVPVHAAPVHDQGRLYVGGSDGMVRAFDITRPRRGGPVLLWMRHLDDEVGGLAAAGGRVYATAGDRLLELDGPTGHPSRRHPMPSVIGSAPTVMGGLIYVTGLGGVVSCLAM